MMLRRHWAGMAARAWVVSLVAAGALAAQQPQAAPAERPRPSPLDRPLDPAPEPPPAPPTADPLAVEDRPLLYPLEPPLGFTGPSGIAPREEQTSSHFVPLEDRWRLGFPAWDRYGKGHPGIDDYPYQEGRAIDPFELNVLKGDYPIIGQHTFFILTAQSLTFVEGRQLPTATTPFESTARPFQEEFFGRPNQLFVNQNLVLNLELNHGDAGFKQPDWRVVVAPTFNINHLDVEELGVISPDVRAGTTRSRTYFALQEYFLEAKLADLSPDFDILSLRVGSQPFTSDFRGFLFSDINRAVRLFGNYNANRLQYNLLYFRQQEKDTNSGLNTFHDRGQDVVIANVFRQDTLWPGYTSSFSVHYNHDDERFKFNKNLFLVRPDPVGIFQPHELNVVYLGWAGDGHINRYNITHQYYWAIGRDTRSPLANQPVDISGHFAAVELSYDRDWARFRTSFLWSSGDHELNNRKATGFDTILDSPNFAGGRFSFFQRQAIPLFGVNLVQNESLIPDLRSSKTQGQSNFVNPGLLLFNVGFDADLTPKLKLITNANYLWFDDTNVLEKFVFQNNINTRIGADLNMGLEYRPLLSNNIIVTAGFATLIPDSGFKQLYNQLRSSVDPLVAGFVEVLLNF